MEGLRNENYMTQKTNSTMTEDNLLLSMMTLRTNGLTLLLKDKIWQNILKKKWFYYKRFTLDLKTQIG